MPTLDTLLHPLGEARFRRDYFGRAPVHLQGEGVLSRSAIFDFDELNRLLAMRGIWTPDRLKVVINSAPVHAQYYLHDEGGGRQTANAAEIEVLLGLGASLVTNRIDELSVRAGEVASLLGRSFAAHVEANGYCSFQGVQAFATHCDLHDVFAIQMSGVKEWRIYANRATDPIAPLEGPGARQIIEQTRGPVLMQVRTEPGDLLYIPRGFYHDALASSTASLHLTFGVALLHGMAVLQELTELARELPAVRAYLPDGRADPADLDMHLADLAEKIAELTRSRRLRDRITDRQHRLPPRAHVPTLPATPKLTLYARTQQQGELVRDGDRLILQTPRGSLPAGPHEEEIAWVLSVSALAAEHLRARFPWLNEDESRAILSFLEQAGMILRQS